MPPTARREWLDWARGVAVVLMVLAHVIDAWTRDLDRDRPAFYRATFVGGLAAPAFLFLAGVGSALSAAAHQRRGASRTTTARSLARRGLTIFGLAFVFRAQAFVLGLGRPVDLLKVDILNVMGPALTAAGLVWGAAATDRGRGALAIVLTGVLAFAAPLVVTWAGLEAVPAPLRWYLQPTPGHTNFTLLPWSGFVTAGLAAGLAWGGADDTRGDRRRLLAVAAVAVSAAGVGYWASWQPSIYAPGVSSYWTSSPAFFFVRLGLVAALLPLCWASRSVMPRRLGTALATLGSASLFVYWVHVELVYGGIAILIKRRVPIELALGATVLGAYGLARLVPIARRWVAAPSGRPEVLRRLVARLL